MQLRIGNRFTLEVSDLTQAAQVYKDLRDASGEGASTWPGGRIDNLTISYNGRVWCGDEEVALPEPSYRAFWCRSGRERVRALLRRLEAAGPHQVIPVGNIYAGVGA